MRIPLTLVFHLVLATVAMAQPSRTDSTMFIQVVVQPAPMSFDLVLTTPHCSIKKTRFTQAVQVIRTINGVVRDSLGQPVPYAAIGTLNAGAGSNADSAGMFSLTVQHTDSLQLKVSAVGYQTKWVRVDDTGRPLEIIMQASGGELEPVVIGSRLSWRRGCGIHCVMQCICILKVGRAVHRETSETAVQPQTLLYPNPARPGMIIHIETGTEPRNLQLLNNAGQLVSQQPVAVLKGQPLLLPL
ncbi:MAG TPA: carboxypeptidase-like regulatory domain-containing protein, partial [Chitinophagaceae bacterium]